MSVSYECCVLSVRVLCVRLITPIECGVSKCDREASIKRRPRPTTGCCIGKKEVPLVTVENLYTACEV
jgi:hypothetical protein